MGSCLSLYPTEGEGLMHTDRRGVFLSLYPTTGQGLIFFIRRGVEFLSLYHTKGKGLYIVVTPLGIRGGSWPEL